MEALFGESAGAGVRVGLAPEALASLTPEERYHGKRLKLRVIVGPDGPWRSAGHSETALLCVISKLHGQPFQAAQHQARTPGQRLGRTLEPQVGHPAQ